MIFDEFQRHALFPTHAVARPGKLPRDATTFQVKTPDGQTLHGIHIVPANPAAGPKLLILGFGGNAWNGQDVATYLHELLPHRDIIVFHYRGYRPSTGTPSADALLADSALVYDQAVARVKPDKVIGVGFSIGSGVAAHLAGQRNVDGLILVTPFDSLGAVVGGMYPMLPVSWLFSHEIDAGAALSETDVPVAIIGGERDILIVPERTNALRAKVRNLVFDRTIAEAGHNDIYHSSDFHHAMREALEAVASAR